jgi:N,N'-diacetyllegionaminate synthase
MRIGDHDVATRVLVVAEGGNNHEGDAGFARELVEQAAAAGAHAIKFQAFRTEHYVSSADAQRFAQLKRFELAPETFAELAELARARGLLFLCTPFDLASAGLLAGIADGLKIASGDNTFVPLLRRVAAAGLPVIVSSGISDEEVLRRAVAVIEGSWPDARPPSLALLHCTSAYPAAPADLDLRAIPFLAERFSYPIGFSDHSIGLEAPLLAVALGARIVEKHFTLEGVESEFRDHALSLTPPQLAELVRRIAEAEEMLGEYGKRVQPGEAPNAVALRRSIAVARDLEAGHVLTLDDLTWLRPGGGIPPGEEERVLGRRLIRPVGAGRRLDPADLSEA